MYKTKIGTEEWIMPKTIDNIKESLYSSFPHERENVNNLFTDMNSLYDAIVGPLLMLGDKGNETNLSILKKYQQHTYRSYIESFLKDKKLQHIFFSQWPFAGLIPEYTSSTFFTLLFCVHAIEGSHYIKGGFESLANVLASVIINNGGEINTSCAVSKLKAENNIIKRVELQTGEIIEADHFISNVSPHHLLNDLLEKPMVNRLWLRRVNQLNCSASALTLYCGLDNGISELLPENILFWYKHADFAKMQERINLCSSNDIDHLILLKTPQASETPTLFLMTYINYHYSNNWASVKEQFASDMLVTAESIMPGFSKHIKCKEIASPSTFKRYSGNTNGSLYGFANLSDRYSEAKIPMQTYIPNLYQTGHWCRGGGIWNVMESGFTVSKMILKKTGVKCFYR